MPPTATNKDRSTAGSTRSSPNPGTSVRPITRRSGPATMPEELQDIKDAVEGQNFLEKHSLLCPPGQSVTHSSLSICLHQISALQAMPKQAVNAIRAVAFLLEEMENTQIHDTIRDTLDSQLTDLTSDCRFGHEAAGR